MKLPCKYCGKTVTVEKYTCIAVGQNACVIPYVFEIANREDPPERRLLRANHVKCAEAAGELRREDLMVLSRNPSSHA